MDKRNVLLVIPAIFIFAVFLSANLFSAQIDTGTHSLRSSNSQSSIQNLSSVSAGDPKSAFSNPQLKKAEVVQKTAKIQIPFVANEGQTDESVKFYANTFGGTVFVTKDGEIVYSLPGKDEKQASGRKKPAARGKKADAGRGVVSAPLLDSMQDCRGKWHSPYFISPLSRGTHPLIPSREGNGVLSGHSQNPDSEQQPPESPFIKGDLRNGGSLSNGRSEPNKTLALKENVSPRPLRERDRVRGVSLKESLIGAKISEVKGEDKSVTNVNYFKGKDPSKWKTNVSTYEMVNLGEIYDGIELKLKAYGNNVEKLFCVKPGADPQQIKVRLSGLQPPEAPFFKGDLLMSPAGGGRGWTSPLKKGARGLLVNEHGELEVETELGPVKFTKPIAYQIINGKRVDVSVEYRIQNSEDIIQKSELNPQSAIRIPNPESDTSSPVTCHPSHLVYSFKVATYDKTKNLIIDPLLASTYLGGTSYDYATSLVVNKNGDIYVAGSTISSDFPTTTGVYETAYHNDRDIFVSKLSSDLTNLLASTYLGGYSEDSGYSLATDSSGNIYVAGSTDSTDFPTILGGYDTYSNGNKDAFISKLDSDLTSLITSTYLGGSGDDYEHSLVVGSDENIYVTGITKSSNFPTTEGAYRTSYMGDRDVFI